jgi:hypothetical protein
METPQKPSVFGPDEIFAGDRATVGVLREGSNTAQTSSKTRWPLKCSRQFGMIMCPDGLETARFPQLGLRGLLQPLRSPFGLSTSTADRAVGPCF